MDQGNIDLQIESCSLEDVLTPVIDSMRLRIEEAGGQLIADIPDSVPDIQADRLHLSNVLYNLLDNAAKYCVQAPFIQLRVQVNHQFVHIVVQDNGIGIGREHHTRVFDRFYRVPTGNIHNVKGFGLGLFYTKRICDAHGWKIRLNSQPGQGTTIAIQLPRMQSAKT
jgi:two-component system phosphate regulon sensor histidine kinase PhoR